MPPCFRRIDQPRSLPSQQPVSSTNGTVIRLAGFANSVAAEENAPPSPAALEAPFNAAALEAPIGTTARVAPVNAAAQEAPFGAVTLRENTQIQLAWLDFSQKS